MSVNNSNPYARMYAAYRRLHRVDVDGKSPIAERDLAMALREIDAMTQDERTEALAAYDFDLWETEMTL